LIHWFFAVRRRRRKDGHSRVLPLRFSNFQCGESDDKAFVLFFSSMVSQFELAFSSPGVYAWEWKQPGFESPINGALNYAAFSNPGVKRLG